MTQAADQRQLQVGYAYAVAAYTFWGVAPVYFVWVKFAEPFLSPPSVHVSLSLWDMDSAANVRADLAAEKIGLEGFDLVFRTWSDTRVARVRMSWMAIGELRNQDDWELY